LFGFAHHVRKPERRGTGKNGEKTDADLILTMHDIPGSAEVSRWAREIVMLSELNEDKDGRKFNLGFWKRASRTGVANNITLRHAKGRIDWEIDMGINGKATGSSKADSHEGIKSELRDWIIEKGRASKVSIKDYARSTGKNANTVWESALALVDGVYLYEATFAGRVYVTTDPNFGKPDPDADRKKVEARIRRTGFVTREELVDWVKSDPSNPGINRATALAKDLSDGVNIFCGEVQLNGNKPSLAFSVGKPPIHCMEEIAKRKGGNWKIELDETGDLKEDPFSGD
jgi:hypothetical protein